MIIPITVSSSSSSTTFSSSGEANPKLPPGLVKISNDEIVLIELQGSLEVEPKDPVERNGKLVGKLKIDEATNKPTLLIGHHLLEGKIGTLPKPYAILVRRGGGRRRETGEGTRGRNANSSNTPAATQSQSQSQRSKNADHPDDVELMDVDGNSHHAREGPESYGDEQDDDDEEEPGSYETPTGAKARWTIAGIVKKKIIFSKRPMPVTVKK